MGKTQTFSFNSNNSRNKKSNEYKKPFFRWKSWLQYMNLKKIWGLLGLWFTLSVIFLSALGVSIWQIIANASPVFNAGIVVAFILLAIIVLPIGLSFLFWGIFKIVLWTAKRTDILYVAQKLLLTAICLNFFFIFFLASINRKEDNLSDTKNFNIRKQRQTNTYNYNPTYGNETRTFSLTSQFTAENDQSSTKHYTAESQTSTAKSNLYNVSYQQNQQQKPNNSQFGSQQATQIFDINPQPQTNPQPQQPTQPEQPQSNFQSQNNQTFNFGNAGAQPQQQPVPPRNPQPNFQQPQAQPKQNTQAFNVGTNQPQRPMGPQQPMPPRGPQPGFQQPPRPMGPQPQQNTQAFNVGTNQPPRPMGPQQPMPPRGPQPGFQQPPRPMGPQQPMPPRGPQLGFQQPPRPMGPQPFNPYQQPMPPRGPQPGFQQPPRPMGPQQPMPPRGPQNNGQFPPFPPKGPYNR